MSLELAKLWPPLRARLDNSLANVAGAVGTLLSTHPRNADQLSKQFFAWLSLHRDVVELAMTSILLWALYRSVRFWIVWLAWLLGFRSKGVTKGSAAARYQSQVYGGYTEQVLRYADERCYGAGVLRNQILFRALPGRLDMGLFCLRAHSFYTTAVTAKPENWLAGLDPSKMNTAHASGALKGFYDRVGEPTTSSQPKMGPQSTASMA